MVLAGVLRQLLDDNSACRHVDSYGKRLSRKDNLYEPIDKAFFNGLFEHGDHPCVVTRNST